MEGKITFVDLAGSERLKQANFEATQPYETAKINKSLFCLGNVVLALAGKKTKKGMKHIPYRNSVLTKLLMGSLGHASFTLLLTCCSPCSPHVEQTLNALNYAQKAMHVEIPQQKRPPPRLPVMKGKEICELNSQLLELEEENLMLKAQLESKEVKSLHPIEVQPPSGRPMHDHLGFSSRDQEEDNFTDSNNIIDEIRGLRTKLKNLETRLIPQYEMSYYAPPPCILNNPSHRIPYTYGYCMPLPDWNTLSPLHDASCHTSISTDHPTSKLSTKDTFPLSRRAPNPYNPLVPSEQMISSLSQDMSRASLYDSEAGVIFTNQSSLNFLNDD